jgi:hypothetical protein
LDSSLYFRDNKKLIDENHMRIINHSSITLLTVLLLGQIVVSCSPIINKEIYKEYPATDISQPITIYQESKKPSPEAEVLGTLTQPNSLHSSKDETITEMTKIAREMGGKGLWIYDISELKPATFASVIRDKDSITFGPILNANGLESILKSQINDMRLKIAAIPVVSFSFDAGYGYMSARTPGLSREEASYEDQLSSGMNWKLSFRHHPSGMNGWGITFNRYTSSGSIPYTISTKYQSNYLGPFFAFCTPSNSKKFLIYFDYGLGVVFAKWNNSGPNASEIVAYNIATQFNIGLDYKLSKHLALSANAGALYYVFSKVYINGQSTSLEESIDGSTYIISVGIKYTLPRKKPTLL